MTGKYSAGRRTVGLIFYYHCDQIPNKRNLKKERYFFIAHSLQRVDYGKEGLGNDGSP